MDGTSASAPNPSNNTFPGDDFSNNLFTDLAPLLALFGDQMTKQFLSMSMGWADNTLIAVCPIGILTIMVSAIRIGGTSQLKTLIGRYESAPRASNISASCYELKLFSLLALVRADQQRSSNYCQPHLEKCARCGAAQRSSGLRGSQPRLNTYSTGMLSQR